MNIDLKDLINTIKNFSAVDREQIIAKSPSSSPPYSTEPGNGKEPKSQELLFKFMKGLFDLAELIKPDRKYVYQMSQFTAEYCELYVDLVCVYHPESILTILKGRLSLHFVMGKNQFSVVITPIDRQGLYRSPIWGI